MKRTRLIRLLLPAAYCIPYAFLSVYGDAISGTLFFYAIMIVSFILLCRVSLKTKNTSIPFSGTLLSFLSSYAAAKFSNLRAMDYYFKPFTAHSLIIVISAAFLLFQSLFVLATMSKRKHRSEL